MSDEYVGSVVLEYGDSEIECLSVSVEISTGAREIYLMKKSAVGKPAGVGLGVRRIKLHIEIPIPTSGNEPKWLDINNAKITVSPVGDGARDVYTGCFVENVSSKYAVNGVAARTVSFVACHMNASQTESRALSRIEPAAGLTIV